MCERERIIRKDLMPTQKISTLQTILFMPPISMAITKPSLSAGCNSLRMSDKAKRLSNELWKHIKALTFEQ